MEIKKTDDIRPAGKEMVTVKKAGAVTEIRYMRSNGGTPIKNWTQTTGWICGQVKSLNTVITPTVSVIKPV